MILVRLVCDLPPDHQRHEDDAVGVRLPNTLLADVVESRRDVLLDCHQLQGRGNTRIDVEIAEKNFALMLPSLRSACLSILLMDHTSNFLQDTKLSREKRTHLLDGFLPSVNPSDSTIAISLS